MCSYLHVPALLFLFFRKGKFIQHVPPFVFCVMRACRPTANRSKTAFAANIYYKNLMKFQFVKGECFNLHVSTRLFRLFQTA